MGYFLFLLLVLLHGIHHLPDLGFGWLPTHGEEHGSNHLLIDRRVLLELSFEEPSGGEEGDYRPYDEGEDDIEDELPDFDIHP